MSRRVNPEVRKERINAIKDTLKSMIFPTVFCLVIGVCVALIIHFASETPDTPQPVPDKFSGSTDPIVLQNDKLIFTLDPTTTDFTIQVKETGKVWHSVAQDVESDTVALADQKANLQSELLVGYQTEIGIDSSLNSFDYSVGRSIYDIESGSDYVTVHYSLGDIDREYRIPPVLNEARYKYIMKQLDMTNSIYIKGNFTKKRKQH